MTRWALLVGGRGEEATSALRRVVALLEAEGLAVGGVFQKLVEGEGVAYAAHHIGGTESRLVAWRGAVPAGAAPSAPVSHCSLTFDREAFEEAARWIDTAAKSADIVAVDPVGRLEAAGHGYHDAIREALGGRALVLLAVRADRLSDVMTVFALDEPLAFVDAADEPALEEFARQLAQTVHTSPSSAASAPGNGV